MLTIHMDRTSRQAYGPKGMWVHKISPVTGTALTIRSANYPRSGKSPLMQFELSD